MDNGETDGTCWKIRFNVMMYGKCSAQGQGHSIFIVIIVNHLHHSHHDHLERQCSIMVKSIDSSHTTWVSAPALPFISSVTVGKLQILSVFQLPSL